MNLSKQLAKHLNNVFFGGNWTAVNFKATLEGVTCEEANQKIGEYNTIVALTYHVCYYIKGVTNVFEGGELDIRDKFSFMHPDITSQAEWLAMQEDTWQAVNRFTTLIEAFPEEKWSSIFVDEKYGNYHSNILGIIEHCHYHLGQIVFLKKSLKMA